MRKGFLAFAALALANTSAQAQYWPAQRPYHPAPMYQPMVMPRTGPTYYYGAPGYYPYPNRVAYPAPTYLPQNAIPNAAAPSTPGATVTVHDGDATAAPTITVQPAPEQISAPTPPASPVAAVPYTAAAPYYGVLSSATEVTAPPVEPVVYHRQCNERWWVSADYRLGWITQGPVATPLLTTAVPRDIGSTRNRGALGDPGTIVLFGDRPLDFRMLNGLGGEVGTFLDHDNCFSVDVGGFYFLPRHVSYRFESPTGAPGLYRPYFSATLLQERSFVVAEVSDDGVSPPISGLSDIDARTQMFGGEINGRWHGYFGRNLHTEVLIGFRSVHLEESLSIRDELTGASGTFGVNSIELTDTILEQDQFLTYNRFYGFQFGGSLRWELPRFYLSGFGKVALGVTDQRVRIEGASSVVSGGQTTQTAVGAILALPSNIDEHDRQVFGVMPEVGVNAAFDVCKHVRLKAGYSCLFWSGVVRPGAQIDRVLNPTQVVSTGEFNQRDLVGLPRPEFRFHETTFFLQQFNFAVELRF